MDDIYTLKRYKKVKKPNCNKPLFLIALVLMLLIATKRNPSLKEDIENKIFKSNFSFSKINELYKKYAGDVLPIAKKDEIPVFEETLNITEKKDYLDGAQLILDNNLIPILDSGFIVFIGETEGYGKTAIVQQANGIDLMYGNLESINLKLYDYVEKGTLLGNTLENKLFLVYKKEGKVLDYENYIKS